MIVADAVVDVYKIAAAAAAAAVVVEYKIAVAVYEQMAVAVKSKESAAILDRLVEDWRNDWTDYQLMERVHGNTTSRKDDDRLQQKISYWFLLLEHAL